MIAFFVGFLTFILQVTPPTTCPKLRKVLLRCQEVEVLRTGVSGRVHRSCSCFCSTKVHLCSAELGHLWLETFGKVSVCVIK